MMLNFGNQAIMSREKYPGVMPGEVSLFYDISEILKAENELNNMFRDILKRMHEHMGMIRGGIVISGEGRRDRLLETINMDYTGDLSEMDVEPVLKRIVESGRPVAVPETRVGIELMSDRDLRSFWSKENMSFFCSPIFGSRRIRGMLWVDRHFGSGLSIEQTLMLLSTIASMISSSGSFELHEMEVGRNSGVFNSNEETIPEELINSDKSFLLKGGTVSERESFTRRLHYDSRRKENPFIYCDCLKLGEDLSEAEIFGRQRSAFLGGASSKTGLLDKASGGTLFLDRIDNLSLEAQARLLKFLEEGKYFSLGSSEPKEADVRIIAGTGRELEEDSDSGRFNMGLFMFLGRKPVEIRSSSPAMKQNHNDNREGDFKADSLSSYDGPLQDSLDSLEYGLIVRQLKLTRGNVSRAAANLGLTQRILGLRLKKYNIDFREYRKKAG